ncbi:MAG: AraC family transcriptional regulator [Ruminococcus sp.]|nr:AraC family transcriptional regulator [Ruminococcus sp.]
MLQALGAFLRAFLFQQLVFRSAGSDGAEGHLRSSECHSQAEVGSVMSVQEDYPTLSVPNHWHNDLEFSYVTKGHMKYSVNGEIVDMNEGDMIFVNSARLHYGFWEKKEPCEFLCVLFGLELLSAVPDSVISKLIGNNSPSYIIFRSSDIEDKTVIDRLTKLNTICEQQKDGYELSAVTLCYETACSLLERCTGTVKELPENSHRLSELHAMIGFIQGHYTEKLSLEDISASGQVCRSKCFELFKEFVGKTPVDYLNEYRISKSIDLLKSSDMNVTEIAVRCGFGNSSYSAEVFRKYIGCSPKEFQKNHKNQL